MNGTPVLSVVVPAAAVVAVLAILVDSWRAMQRDRRSPLTASSVPAMEKAYLAQLAPTENEVVDEPALAASEGTTAVVVESSLTDAELAIFEANVHAVARFAQRQRKCVRLDAAALCSLPLTQRAAAILQTYQLDDVCDADGEHMARGCPLLSGLVCRGTNELLMWAHRLSQDAHQPGVEPAAWPQFPITLLLAAPPLTLEAWEQYGEACHAAQRSATPTLTCACAIATLEELASLQELVATHALSAENGVEEITVVLDTDLTYRSASRTVGAVKRVYEWGLGRGKAAPPLRAPADVMTAQTMIASWNHQRCQPWRLGDQAMPPDAAPSAPLRLPLFGLCGFLLTSRRTSVETQPTPAASQRRFLYYVRQTLRRWGNAVCWAALHSPLLYPLVHLARSHARREAAGRVTELIQWYIFGSTSFGEKRIYSPRPPGELAMQANDKVTRTTDGKGRPLVPFRVVEEEDLFVIHEGLPIVWQRPTTEEMRDHTHDNGDCNSTEHVSPLTASLYAKARKHTEHGEQVIALTTDASTLVVVECTVGAKTLYRGLSATIPGLKALRR